MSDDSQLLKDFIEQVKLPIGIKETYDRLEAWRKYVHTDALLEDEDDSVSTHYLYRNQVATLARLYPQEPTAAFMPKPTVSGIPTPEATAFADTLDILINEKAKEANLKDIARGLCQDALTTPMAIMKVDVQEDETRDPAGVRVTDHNTLALQNYKRLYKAFKNDEFDKESGEYESMLDALGKVQELMIARVDKDMVKNPPELIDTPQGFKPDMSDPRFEILEDYRTKDKLINPKHLPKNVHHKAFAFTPFDLDDFRWDWSVKKPELMHTCRWMAVKHWYTRAELLEQFEVDEDDMTTNFAEDKNPENTDVDGNRNTGSVNDDATNNSNSIAVWEMWDRTTQTVYIWTQEVKKFLRKTTPSVTSRRWFPFVPLAFSRVSGRMLPICDTQLQQPLQDEINENRTLEREAKNASYPRFGIPRGILTKTEKTKAETAQPFSMVEFEKADELNKSIFTFTPGRYDPSMYDISKARMDMEAMAAMPQAALGNTGGAGLATEVAYADTELKKQTSLRQSYLNDFLTTIYEMMADIAIQIYSPEEVEQIVGQGGYFPLSGKDKTLAQLNITMVGNASGDVESEKMMQFMMQSIPLAAQLGAPLNGEMILRLLLKAQGLQVDPVKFMQGRVPQMAGDTGGANANNEAGPGAPPIQSTPDMNQVRNNQNPQ